MKLTFLGDFCQTKAGKLHISDQLMTILNESDLVCLNLEGPIINSDSSPRKKIGPSLNQSDEILGNLQSINCTHLSLANNHIMDFGPEGLQSTLDKLTCYETFGAALNYRDAYSPSVFKEAGKNVALFSFGESQFGVINSDFEGAGFASITNPEARRQVKEASENNDFVIVQVHAGLEMCPLPLPEWRSIYKEFIHLGADVVIGHHPHILQGKESYLGKSIFYSLGNFFMDAMVDSKQTGGVLQLEIKDDLLTESLSLICEENGKIGLSDPETSAIELKKLSSFCGNESTYIVEMEDICLKHWREIYEPYYSSSMSGIGTKLTLRGLKKLIFRFIRLLTSPKSVKEHSELLLLHNIKIESHRWVAERALNSQRT